MTSASKLDCASTKFGLETKENRATWHDLADPVSCLSHDEAGSRATITIFRAPGSLARIIRVFSSEEPESCLSLAMERYRPALS